MDALGYQAANCVLAFFWLVWENACTSVKREVCIQAAHLPMRQKKNCEMLAAFFFLRSCKIFETLHDGNLHWDLHPNTSLMTLILLQGQRVIKKGRHLQVLFSHQVLVSFQVDTIYGHYTHWPEMRQMLFITISCAKSRSLLPCSWKVCVTVVSSFWISERSQRKFSTWDTLLWRIIACPACSCKKFVTMSKFQGYWELWSWELHFLRSIKILLI